MIAETLFALIVCTAAGEGEGNQPPSIVVHCKQDAEIRGAEVLLRDLADVRSDDAELTARLMGISFGRRPAPGYSRVLSRQDVLLRLVRAGVGSSALKITGAVQVVLHPRITRLRVEELRDAADPVLRAALELDGTDVEFEPTTRLSTLVVPPGRYSQDLRARLTSSGISHSSATVEVVVLVDDAEFKVVRIPYRLRRFQQVLLTTRVIKRGEPLSGDNVEVRRVETSTANSPYLMALAEVRGKVAARDLRGGHRMTLSTITLPAVVFKGDLVNLVAVNGRIRVATQAVALQDASVGDRVRVRQLSGANIVQATVRGRGLVVIQGLRSDYR